MDLRWGLALLAVTLPTGLGALTLQETMEVPAEPRLLDLHLDPVFGVGAPEGSDEDLFGEITGVAFGPAGDLYVLDRARFHVASYAPDGTFRRFLGREGGGPGEFTLPSGLAVDAAGNVWVGDVLGRSVEVFGPTGDFVRSIPVDDAGRPDLGSMTSAEAGAVLVPARPRDATDGSIPLLRIGLEGSVDEVGRLSVLFVPRMEQAGATSFRRVQPPVFTAPSRVVALPDGRRAEVVGPRYSVRIAGREGVEAEVVSQLDPAPVTEADREEEKEWRRRRNRELAENPPPAVGGFRMTAASEERLEEALADLEFADVHPVIRSVAADPSGTLWIQRWGGRPRGPAPVDLVSTTAGYMGTLPAMDMPGALGPGGLVAFVREDELGVQRVEVVRARR